MPDTELTEDTAEDFLDDDGAQEAARIEHDGDRIDASDALLSGGARYGQYVNEDRALPDIRDGFKPVQRRIVYGMHEQGLRHDRKPKKSANAVGHIMGSYHPHGDSSIYEALAKLAQPFTCNLPIISGQGNFGSNDDPPAAMRYTEAKLSQASTEMCADLRPEVVDFVPNFDDSTTEPSVIPVTFPVLLVNGSQGIGWAMACDVPTHNLAEAIDAAVLVAEKPDATLKQVLRRLPGPDFPSAGIIANPSVLEEAYATGRGTFVLQGRWHIENVTGAQQAVVITELPYKVGLEQFKAEIIERARAEDITEVTEIPTAQENKHGFKVTVKVKRGGSAQALAAQLLRHTSLSKTFKVNFTVLRDGTPQTVSLMEILQAFAEFRVQVVTKRLEHERASLMRELHRLYALRGCMDVIDKVVKIIRTSKDDEASVQALRQAVKARVYGQKAPKPIDAEQAQFILDMRLKRINQLNQFKLDDDIKARETRVAEIDVILSDPAKITAEVVTELKDVKKRYGQPRATVMTGVDAPAASAEPGAPAAAAVPKTDCTIFVSRSGQAISFARAPKLKVMPLKVSASDELAAVLDSDTEASLHVFTQQGICYRVRAAELGLDSRKGKGRPICAAGKGDGIAAVLDASAPGEHLAFVTARGEVKRLPAEALASSHAGGIPAVGVADGDRLIAALPHGPGSQLIVHTAAGKALRTELDRINPKKGGAAGGMTLMKLAGPSDEIVSAALVPASGRLAVVHAQGMAKAVSLDDYPVKGRGGSGVASADPGKPSRTPAGPVALAAPVPDGADLLILTRCGEVLPVQAAGLQTVTRAAVSKALIDLGPGDQAALILAQGA